jgi:hypothetical protein
MTLHATLAIWAFAAVLVLLFLALLLWQAGGDQEERRTVPVRPAIIVLVAALVVALGAGTISTNIASATDSEQARAEAAFIQLDSGFALGGTPDSPAGDILDGDNNVKDPALVHDLATGKAVPLSTGSGKPATAQLFAVGKEILPVVTYDGKEDLTLTVPFTDKPTNTSGFPQVIPLPDLPKR